MKKICFIGLGTMGYPMAGHLSVAGYEVSVFNRTISKAEDWVQQYQGKHYQTPREAVQNADLILICVGNDDDVRSVFYGQDGILENSKKEGCIIDHTTASYNLAIEMQQACQKNGLNFLDAPVSGGQAGAENGQLSIMVGGEQDVFEQQKSILKHYAKKIELIGTTGHGQLTKMVNQICIAGLVQSLSEGLKFAEATGLNIEKVFDVITKGAAQSWQMENRAKTMHERKFNFGFALDWMRKDLNICLEAADSHQVALPITAQIDQLYKQLQIKGKGKQDTSSLIELLD